MSFPASPFPLTPIRSRLIAAASAVLLSACAGLPAPKENAPIQRDVRLPAYAISGARDAWPQRDWWTAYGDPQLNALMQEALGSSPTLALAQARLEHAEAVAGSSRAAGGPQVAASGEATYGRQSENYLMPPPPLGHGGQYVSQGQLAIGFGYDIDLWGRNAALIRAAQAQVDAAVFDRDAARLALTTSIARAYSQLSAQYELRDVLLDARAQRQAIRKLVDQRVANGLDTQVETKQAESNEASLQVDIEQLDTALKLTRLQIATLAGRMPDFAATIRRPALADAPFPVPAGLTLDLLGRRPELAAQRARIDAAIRQTDAAKAEFYPNVNFKALIGVQAIGLGHLLSDGSLMSSVGPAIHLPLFDSGRLRANYAARTSDVDAAIAQYNQSVLGAAQDVAEQLTRAADLAREETAAKNALTAAEEAHRLAMLRYRGGLSPYLTVLTVETNLLAQRRVLAALKSRHEEIRIALIRALGGGFESPVGLASARPNK